MVFILELITAVLLTGKCQLGPAKDKYPAEKHPDQKERQGGKRTIDRIIIGDADLEADIEILGNEPERCPKKGADKCWQWSHVGIREKDINQEQGQSDKKERDEEEGCLDPHLGEKSYNFAEQSVVFENGIGCKTKVNGKGHKDEKGQVIGKLA